MENFPGFPKCDAKHWANINNKNNPYNRRVMAESEVL